MKRAAEDLRVATNAAASNALKKKLVNRLENAAKQAVASATQLISASKAAGPSNRNPSSQQQLQESCKVSDELRNRIKGDQPNLVTWGKVREQRSRFSTKNNGGERSRKFSNNV